MLARASSQYQDFLHRHHLATVAMLVVHTGKKEDSVYRQLHRMELKKRLRSHRHGRTLIYQLRDGPSLGPQQLPIAYAIAMHCAEQDLHKPSALFVRTDYPWLDGVDFALDEESNVILFRVHISGKSDAQVRKVADLNRRLSQYPEYSELLQGGKVRVHILTAEEHKAKEINFYINRAGLALPVRVATVSGYTEILGGNR